MAGGRHRIMVHAGIRLRAQEKIATAGAHCTGEADRYGGEGASRAGARARCPSPLLHALGRDLVQHWEHLAELLHLPLMLLCRRRRLLVLAPRERHDDPHLGPSYATLSCPCHHVGYLDGWDHHLLVTEKELN